MKLEIPSGEFAGYIFDLDGTLVDTMPLHYRAWDESMRKVGLTAPLDEELFYSLGGVPTKRVAELIAAHYGLTIDAHAVFDHKEALFVELQKDAKLIEPVVEFARRMSLTHPVSSMPQSSASRPQQSHPSGTHSPPWIAMTRTL